MLKISGSLALQGFQELKTFENNVPFSGSKQGKKNGARNGKRRHKCATCNKRQRFNSGRWRNSNALWQLYSDDKQTAS
jgi:hypothetical protein